VRKILQTLVSYYALNIFIGSHYLIVYDQNCQKRFYFELLLPFWLNLILAPSRTDPLTEFSSEFFYKGCTNIRKSLGYSILPQPSYPKLTKMEDTIIARNTFRRFMLGSSTE